jgi:hypothetical protein
MTQDEQMDRLERSLRLFLKRPTREPRNYRESRLTADKVGAYVKALQDRDNAKEAFAAKPGDSEVQEILRQAQEVLDRVRDELKH